MLIDVPELINDVLSCWNIGKSESEVGLAEKRPARQHILHGLSHSSGDELRLALMAPPRSVILIGHRAEGSLMQSQPDILPGSVRIRRPVHSSRNASRVSIDCSWPRTRAQSHLINLGGIGALSDCSRGAAFEAAGRTVYWRYSVTDLKEDATLGHDRRQRDRLLASSSSREPGLSGNQSNEI